MGGQGQGATPTTPSGYTGGSAMDYTAPTYSPSPIQPSGFNWGGLASGVGTGLQGFGSSLQNQQTPNITMPQWQQSSGPNIPNVAVGGAGIPATGQTDQTAVFEMLKRLFEEYGGYG